jgi:hypothetical protein
MPTPITVLSLLVEEMNNGRIKIVDLTQPFGPETPVIGLPPQFAQSPSFSMETISRYDADGPAWYWNTIHLGEHTGTHFDAPAHWITGKELANNTLDTLPVRKLPTTPSCTARVNLAWPVYVISINCRRSARWSSPHRSRSWLVPAARRAFWR